MDQDETSRGDKPRPRPHCIRWGPSFPPPKKRGAQPPFAAHVRCGQTTGWIKLPLRMEVGLGPSDFVLDGEGAQPLPPNFPPMSIVAKRLDGLRCHLVHRYALAQATLLDC